MISRATIAAAAAAAATTAVLTAAPAAAVPRPVSAGDPLVTASTLCTLGYTYTTPAGRLIGITAGHCDPGGPNRTVIDKATGARGEFLLTVHNADQPGADDYALINFGSNREVPGIHGLPTNPGIQDLDTSKIVCRDGIRTSVQCGNIAPTSYGANQHLTLGMPDSIPGDSGAPVWQIGAAGQADIVGIWLGRQTTTTGQSYGRFLALRDAVEDLPDRTATSA
ncbi:S1 family peptidase [Mycolicibacterium mageritense]|uniref:S1 family peptidase n=1 Tax=Mycolicibacterium mageritense TaxID=53462 RepID=UPI001E296637|nr:S1 family peptidase [Mycolicibacterium mageritense]MCC9186701.1 S1 family peptidase [Mycolicibacterium mageritense]